MSTHNDITKKSKQESGGFLSEPQPENTARARRACDDDHPDRITHHNERPDPAQLTTYDPAGEIPFSNWDGEEGPRP